MAIVKMKKLRLMVVRSRKDELLRELAREGEVQIDHVEAETLALPAREGASASASTADLMTLKSRQLAVEQALTLLDRYAPVKTPLLSAKPELEKEIFLGEDGLSEAEEAAEIIRSCEDRIKRITAEESRQRGIVETLTPWQELELPLECEGTQRTQVILGSISARQSLGEVQSALAQATEEAELFPVSDDGAQQYIALVCIKEALPAVQECLRGFSFNPAALSGHEGTAREGIISAEKALQTLAEEKTACAERIAAQGGKREALRLAYDKLGTRIAIAGADGRLARTESVAVLEGWMPADREGRLAKVFDRLDCAWESRDPEPSEYEQVPVRLKNNRFTNSLNMVTNMYSLPAYGTIDSNPWMAFFFILFFGLMMADMGYGLLMIVAALAAMKKIKPKDGTLAFCQLLLYGGISTFVMGALTGGFFSDLPYRLVHALRPGSSWEGLPALFSPVRDSNAVLYGSLALGLIQLNVGMLASFLFKKRNGRLADGVWEEGSLWVILLGGILFALTAVGVLKALAMRTAAIVVLAVGAAMLLFGAGRHSTGILGKIGAAFGAIYNTVTGWFGDILSYSRIMALMLAGSVIGQVFNTIAVMPLEKSLNPFTVLAFLIIFLLGHAINFGLNLLGCFVHDLRLQCLEYYGKFFTDGGKPFSPLAVKPKYVTTRD